MRAPTIAHVHVTQWNGDEWTGAPYSSLGVGGRSEHRATLCTPIGSRVLLAGEHCSVRYPATMHGAFESGVAAAEQLTTFHHSAGTVTVIGAGLAGLGAARTLRQRGWRVTILEATDRTGGRARAEVLPSGETIHPGAAWIHGIVGNPITELADRTGVTYERDWPARTCRRRSDGTRADVDASRIEAAAEHALAELASLAADAVAAGDADEAMRPRLDAALERIVDGGLRAAVRVHLHLHFESLMAAELDELSFQRGDEPYAYPGGDAYITSSLSPLVAHLAEGLDIRHALVATRVHVDGPTVHVRTAAGMSFTADACIVAIPLGPLRAGSIAFDPPLPATHREALAALHLGHKCKVFVAFDERWWGDAQELWCYPVADDASAPTRWGTWVDVSAPAGVPMLCGFVGGSEAVRVQGLARDPARADALRSEIARALAPFSAPQPL